MSNPEPDFDQAIADARALSAHTHFDGSITMACKIALEASKQNQADEPQGMAQAAQHMTLVSSYLGLMVHALQKEVNALSADEPMEHQDEMIRPTPNTDKVFIRLCLEQMQEARLNPTETSAYGNLDSHQDIRNGVYDGDVLRTMAIHGEYDLDFAVHKALELLSEISLDLAVQYLRCITDLDGQEALTFIERSKK